MTSNGKIFTESINTKVFGKTPIFVPVGPNFPCQKGMKYNEIDKSCFDIDECKDEIDYCENRNISNPIISWPENLWSRMASVILWNFKATTAAIPMAALFVSLQV